MSNKALDLDLEFEEEVEKKNDELDVADLSFSVAPEKEVAKTPPPEGKVLDLPQTKKNNAPPKVQSDEKTNPNLVIPKELNEDIDLDSIHQVAEDKVSLTPMPKASEKVSPNPQTKTEVKIEPKVSAGSSQTAPLTASVMTTNIPLDKDGELRELREQLMKTREEAARKIAILEFKTDFLLDILVETKSLDSKVNQVLNQIFKKAPATKNEVLMIKKMLLEYVQKVEKKKGS